jgi:uncharacterized protein YcbK (DUF882 family)
MGGGVQGGRGFRAEGRRAFLRRAVGLAGGMVAMCPRTGSAYATRTRSLGLYAVNTGERLRVDYCIDGRYEPQSLRALDHLLRDFRTDEVYPVDPRVLDILYDVGEALESASAYHVVCGYRSPATNEMKLRQGRGVARNSYHLTGKAIDVFLPSRGLRDIRRAALALGAGGVGYYPRAGFVHLDIGPVRTW